MTAVFDGIARPQALTLAPLPSLRVAGRPRRGASRGGQFAAGPIERAGALHGRLRGPPPHARDASDDRTCPREAGRGRGGPRTVFRPCPSRPGRTLGPRPAEIPSPFAKSSDALARFAPWIVLGWIAGVGLLAVRAAGGWVVAGRLARRDTRPRRRPGRHGPAESRAGIAIGDPSRSSSRRASKCPRRSGSFVRSCSCRRASRPGLLRTSSTPCSPTSSPTCGAATSSSTCCRRSPRRSSSTILRSGGSPIASASSGERVRRPGGRGDRRRDLRARARGLRSGAPP